MGFLDFFKGLGSRLASVFKFVQKVVPDEQLDKAIDLVAEAGKKFIDNDKRREWAVRQLMSAFPIPESIARLIIELAVTHTKHGIDAAGQAVKDSN